MIKIPPGNTSAAETSHIAVYQKIYYIRFYPSLKRLGCKPEKTANVASDSESASEL